MTAAMTATTCAIVELMNKFNIAQEVSNELKNLARISPASHPRQSCDSAWPLRAVWRYTSIGREAGGGGCCALLTRVMNEAQTVRDCATAADVPRRRGLHEVCESQRATTKAEGDADT